MVTLDLVRIKRLRYLGTYVMGADMAGGELPEMEIMGKTVSMYSDFEMAPTTHYIIDDGDCRMYMRHSSGNNMYSSWDEFTEKK